VKDKFDSHEEPIKLYIAPSCSSCKKAEDWFKAAHLAPKKIDLDQPDSLKREDILQMLENSFDGFNDIISTRANVYKELKSIKPNPTKEELRDPFFYMTVDEQIATILNTPLILKRPIIVQGKRMRVGFNEEEISIFIPDKDRQTIINSESYDEIFKENVCLGKYIIRKVPNTKDDYGDGDVTQEEED
jgi:regulatory protein spx